MFRCKKRERAWAVKKYRFKALSRSKRPHSLLKMSMVCSLIWVHTALMT